MSNPARKTVLLAALVALALPLAGCVENMNDLKAKVTGESVESTSTDKGATALNPANVTKPLNVTKPKPPVARVSIFGAGGALTFKAGFAADETLVPSPLEGGTTVTFSASDSEAVDAKAALQEYTWSFVALSKSAAPASGGHDAHAGHDAVGLLRGQTFDESHEGHGAAAAHSGDGTMTGVSVQHAFPAEGGVWLVTLAVKDSLGGVDTQSVKIGVNPAKVVKSVTYKDTIAAGHSYLLPGADGIPAPDSKTHVFNVSATVDEMPAKAVAARLHLTGAGPTAVDLDLTVLDPAGAEAASSFTGSSSDEKVDLSGLAPGDWTAVVSANLGVAADYQLVVDITYQPEHPDVAALLGGMDDGHGGHAH